MMSLPSVPKISDQPKKLLEAGIEKLSLFYRDKRAYAYVEHRGGREHKKKQPAWDAILKQILISAAPEIACSEWHSMSEVFHMGIE